MVPDKIYIQPNAYDGWFEGNKPNDNFVEFIRKDALLEWLQKEYETNRRFYETHAKPGELHIGRCEAYKKVIDKLEAM